MAQFQKWLKAFVPRYIGTGPVLVAYRFMSAVGKISEEGRQKHLEQNTRLLQETPRLLIPGQYIENQAQWDKVMFGKHTTIAAAGCSVIAVYNALLHKKRPVDEKTLPGLVHRLEGRGVAFGGKYGVDPREVRRLLSEEGFRVEECKQLTAEAVNRFGNRFQTFILLAYNNSEDITDCLHYVCITKEGQLFMIHNCYHRRESIYCAKDGGTLLWEAISNISDKKPKAICVMAIEGV